MPLLLMTVPAFWAMFMVAMGVEMVLAMVLDILPLAIALAVHDYAGILGPVGVAVALLGNYFQLSELLLNRNTARDMLFMLSGATLVLATFLVHPEWPLFVGRSIFAVLTLFFPAAIFGRAIMDRTETAFSTLSLIILCLVGLCVLSWLVVF